LTYLPEWLDAGRKFAGENVENAAGVDDEKCYRENHGYKHDTETRADDDYFPNTESVFTLDCPE
jgi:hypothetical protein